MATRSLSSFFAFDRSRGAPLKSAAQQLLRRLLHAILESRRRKAEHDILVFLEISGGNLPPGVEHEFRRRLRLSSSPDAAVSRNAGTGDSSC